mmetsp:Transcript_6220/g.15625  ORF Transcript_6220/g.15625 Transcript_6220/m.15625 type:complete len:625 (+) Transcript_6220:194-2068(+)
MASTMKERMRRGGATLPSANDLSMPPPPPPPPLADALSGVVGSLVALWVFYPLDVVKINIQAAASSSSSSSETSSASSEALLAPLQEKESKTEEPKTETTGRQGQAPDGQAIELLPRPSPGFSESSPSSSSSSSSSSTAAITISSTSSSSDDDDDDDDAEGDDVVVQQEQEDHRLEVPRGSGSPSSVVVVQPDRPSSSSSSSHQLNQKQPIRVITGSTTLLRHYLKYYYTKKGLGWKTVQTVASNFCYFYIHSWMVASYSNSNNNNSSNNKKRNSPPSNSHTHTSTKLLLSAVAAMINTFITLPLDVVASRRQVVIQQRPKVGASAASPASPAASQAVSVIHDNDERIVDVINGIPIIDETNSCRRTSVSVSSSSCSSTCLSTFFSQQWTTTTTFFKKKKLQEVGEKYWKGLMPALMLCSNPAINFTVYDIIKNWVLVDNDNHTDNRSRREKMSMVESFMVGLVSKIVATIITYPLIRAKVMMMTSSSSSSSTSPTITATDYSNNNNTSTDAGSSSNYNNSAAKKTKSLTLWMALLKCYYENSDDNDNNKNDNKKNGNSGDDESVDRHDTAAVVGDWRGLYKGCNYQILHTACKAALMMCVRERISHEIHHILTLSERDRKSVS